MGLELKTTTTDEWRLNMERTIRVTGKGNITVAPDRIRIQVTVSGVRAEYKGAVEKSAAQTGEIRSAIKAAGLAPQDLKTEMFSVNTEYKEYKDENDNWHRKFVGYKFIHRMHIEFANDNELLGKVLYELSRCPAKVEFRILHTISDPERAKDDLLANAVADAVKKAEVLAQAADVHLGDIVSIDHSWEEIDFYSNQYLTGEDSLENIRLTKQFKPDIEADDIQLSDTVTMVWKIE